MALQTPVTVPGAKGLGQLLYHMPSPWQGPSSVELLLMAELPCKEASLVAASLGLAALLALYLVSSQRSPVLQPWAHVAVSRPPAWPSSRWLIEARLAAAVSTGRFNDKLVPCRRFTKPKRDTSLSFYSQQQWQVCPRVQSVSYAEHRGQHVFTVSISKSAIIFTATISFPINPLTISYGA